MSLTSAESDRRLTLFPPRARPIRHPDAFTGLREIAR